jgi:hypothetical protein
MKIKLILALFASALAVAGCVGTVGGGKTFGNPMVKDRAEGRYERSVEEVFQAAKDVVSLNGTLINESVLHTQTNEVKTVTGKVNQRSIWVRIEAVDPKVTDVTVQARTSGGAGDVDLAHQLEKQIALKLVR